MLNKVYLLCIIKYINIFYRGADVVLVVFIILCAVIIVVVYLFTKHNPDNGNYYDNGIENSENVYQNEHISPKCDSNIKIESCLTNNVNINNEIIEKYVDKKTVDTCSEIKSEDNIIKLQSSNINEMVVINSNLYNKKNFDKTQIQEKTDYSKEKITIFLSILKYLVKNKENVEESKTRITDREDIAEIEFVSEDYTTIANEYKPQKINYGNKKISKVNNIYYRIKQMRKIQYSVETAYEFFSMYFEDSEGTFVKQAEYMKDVTDNYSYVCPLDIYYPKFEDLNDSQLRTYFTWRTKIRNNMYCKIDISYVFLYIYELINKVSALEDTELIKYLIEFWNKYREFDSRIDGHLKLWIKDFYIINNITIPFVELNELFPKEYRYNLNIKDRFKDNDYKKYLAEINRISDYKFINSKFYSTEYGYLLEDAIDYSFKRIYKYMSERDVDFNCVLGKDVEYEENYWRPFPGAVYFESNDDKKPVVIEFGFGEKYEYKFNKWYYYSMSYKYNYNGNVIGYIIKLIENNLRVLLGYKYKLRPSFKDNNSGWFYSEKAKKLHKRCSGIVSKKEFVDFVLLVVSEFFKTTGISEQVMSEQNNKRTDNNALDIKASKFEIDINKFDSIRESSMNLQKILVIDEEPEENGMVSDFDKQIQNINIPKNAIRVEDNIGNEYAQLIDLLNSNERKLIHIAAFSKKLKKDIDEFKVNTNEMLEIMCESINEKSLELISDNIIELEDEIPVIYDDYIDAIKKVLEEGEYGSKDTKENSNINY